MAQHVAAIDQGTTSTRCLIFDERGAIVAGEQLEHAQRFPKPGWVEHDALEILANARRVLDGALARAGLRVGGLAAIGVANQRETAVVWDRATGAPIHPAIVWQDTRTQPLCDALAALGGGTSRYREKTGLPLATYFSGPKIRWILDAVPGARERAARGELLFGTIDAWLVWNLTGGPGRGAHVTDPTNASRTMLMDLRTLGWDPGICEEVGVPPAALPEIRSSSEIYGSFQGVPIAGILGDQQAAAFGQACFAPSAAKNTYGTGCFLLLATGDAPVPSRHGLVTTVAYALPGRPPAYALEGSVAVAGALVQWLRDNLGIIASASDIEPLARSVGDNGGCCVVPAFSGLFAPRWRPDARGVIVGLTRYVTKAHIARAALEATAFQTREVVDAMRADSGVALAELRVDGGMTANALLMQFQADILGVPVVRPKVTETTALGAATAAGLAVGVWSSPEELRRNWAEDRRFAPAMGEDERAALYSTWQKAVERTYGWA